MKIAIIQFPGSNCERETMLAVERAQMEPVPCLWNEPKEKLDGCDGYIIVGGFSYEDRGRAGLIASLDPIIQYLYDYAAQGKPILGICNGAQVLVESGLVPGLAKNQVAMALTENKRMQHGHVLSTGFYNDWVKVAPLAQQKNSAFLRYVTPKEPMHIPMAHAEGRFILAPKLLQELQQHDVGMLQYIDFNPNGSDHDLAAVCNLSGNVMAMMPHPERTPNGDAIFNSMRDYIQEHDYPKSEFLDFAVPKIELSAYKAPARAMQMLVELIITDNVAVSLEQALHNLDFKVKLTRQTHWEIAHNSKPQQLQQDLIASYELFNPNKERLADNTGETANSFVVLVQDKDNLLGQHKHEVLADTFEIDNINSIKHGTLWRVNCEKGNMDKIKTALLNKHVFFNPFAHNCFLYED